MSQAIETTESAQDGLPVDHVDRKHPWTGGSADDFLLEPYETPRGGEWYLPSAEPFDAETGVENLEVLESLNGPAKRLNDKLTDPEDDLSDLEPEPIPDGTTRAAVIRSITSDLLAIFESKNEG